MSRQQREGFGQVVICVVDGFGIGALADSATGANTLHHLAAYAGGLELPFLQWMGLGNVAPTRGLPPAEPPAASVGRMGRRTDDAGSAGAFEEMLSDVLSNLVAAGVAVDLLGAVAGELAEDAGSSRESDLGREAVLRRLVSLTAAGGEGVVIASFATEASSGGPVAAARQLEWFDAQIPNLLDAVDEGTLLLIAGLTGHDALLAGGGQTREYVPLLAYTPAVPSGIDLGTRDGLGDIGATLADNYGLEAP